MRLTICLSAAAILCAGSVPADAKTAAKHAAVQLNHTTWTFAEKDGTKVRASIDAKGNYIDNAVDGKHLDHGTAAMKHGKACFTSAMTNEGEVCWTMKPVSVGHSFVAVSSKGEKLKVTRVKYVKLEMPA